MIRVQVTVKSPRDGMPGRERLPGSLGIPLIYVGSDDFVALLQGCMTTSMAYCIQSLESSLKGLRGPIGSRLKQREAMYR